MSRCLNTIILVVLCKISISNASTQDYKLELLQVLFRHGDRIPEESEIYKSDPDIEYYEKEDFGQLTKVGLQREYEIGQMLRERYNDFLGEYKGDEVYARSTDFDRTKMSLQMVLAGLYPPSNRTSWSNSIFWAPIPTHYVPVDIDPFRFKFIDKCKQYMFATMFAEAENSIEVQEEMHKYKYFLDYLQGTTGITNGRPFTVFLIYSNLRAVLSMGLPLPKWCSAEHFEKLEAITDISYKVLSFTRAMRERFVGLMLNEFLSNIDDDENSADLKKIYLYGAHDTNIADITRAHNFTGIPAIPDYGSAIVIEKLRGQHDGKSYIKMLLWTGVSKQLISLKINDCGTVCLLSQYKKIIQSTLADNKITFCTSPRRFCTN